MTSRQRVLAALNHEEPDKIPIDLGGTMCSSLTRGANEKLKTYLNIETEPETITNPLTDSIAVSEEILDLFRVDFRTVRLKGPDNQTGPADAQITIMYQPFFLTPMLP